MDNDSYGQNLMDLMGETEHIEIFQTKAVQDFINYKWEKYGKKVHYISACNHIIYVISFLIYTNEKYLERSDEHQNHSYIPLTVMLLCNLYGMFYDMTQLFKQG
jgi:hypothetical protein